MNLCKALHVFILGQSEKIIIFEFHNGTVKMINI